MRQRFNTGKTSSSFHQLMISILCFFVVLGLFYMGTGYVSDKTMAQEKQTLKQAIDHGIVQCYALEGSYPENLQYLKENYGLTYDENKFFVDYQTIGSNILPDVTVIEKEESK